MGIRKCLALLMLGSAAALAEPEQLRLAVPDTAYPPYVVSDEAGVHGTLIAPLRAAATAAGIELVFTLAPELRSQKMLQRGVIDGRMESPDWIDNPDDFLWTALMLPMRDVLVYHQRHRPAQESDVALKNYEIIAHLGYAYPQLQAWFDSGHAVRLDKTSELKMLLALTNPDATRSGRAAVVEQGVAQWLLKQAPELRQQPLVVGDRTFGCALMGFQLRKTERIAELLQRLNKHSHKSANNRC